MAVAGQQARKPKPQSIRSFNLKAAPLLENTHLHLPLQLTFYIAAPITINTLTHGAGAPAGQ